MSVTLNANDITMGSGSVIQNPSGTAPCLTCRAWVSFNGVGTVTIRGSGNVSSMTDLAVGRYRMNYSTAMTDVNYVLTTSSVGISGDMELTGMQDGTTPATGSIDLWVKAYHLGLSDSSYIFAAIYR
jgi:hypothetical protein